MILVAAGGAQNRRSSLLTASLLIIQFFSTLVVPVTAETVKLVKRGSFPYALTELPIPPSLFPNVARFGCGVSITPDGGTIVALGADKVSGRQFAQLYIQQTNAPLGSFIAQPLPFFGDLVTNAFLNFSGSSYSPGASCPICLSSDRTWLLMGGWLTTTASWSGGNSSLVVAKLDTTQMQYQFHSRIFTGVSINASRRLFASDLICSADLGTIIIAEQGLTINDTGVLTIVKKQTTQSNGADASWVVNSTLSYISSSSSTPYLPPLNLGMAGDGSKFAVTSRNFSVEVRSTTDGSLMQSLYLNDVVDGMPIINVALDYNSSLLLVTAQGPTFIGERYVYSIEYSPALAVYNLSSAILVTDPDMAFNMFGAGSQLAFVPVPRSDPASALSIGLPNFPINPTDSLNEPQSGALSVWKTCQIAATSTTAEYLSWLRAYSYAKPFAPGLVLADGLGASYASHNIWSADGKILVGSAPVGISTGRVFLFTGLVPVCGPAPQSPPPPAPTAGDEWRIGTNVLLGISFVVLIGVGLMWILG